MARPLEARRVKAVLWKRLTATDAAALLDIAPPAGTGGGAKHLPLRPDLPVADFLGEVNRSGGTASEPKFAVSLESAGGEVRNVPVEYDLRGGEPPRREWRIPRQNRSKYRPSAWNPGAKLPVEREAIPDNYILVIRLADGSFHARVAFPDEILEMPAAIRDRILASDQDILEF